MFDNIFGVLNLEVFFDGKPETNGQFQYGRRSVRRLHEALEKSNKKSNKNSNIKIPKYETLRNYCHKFNWVKRAEAYDDYHNNLRKEEIERLMSDALLDEARFSHGEIIKSYEQLSYITNAFESLHDDLLAGHVSSLDYASGILKLMTAYEKAGKSTKYFRPDKDEKGLIVNNINQVAKENHMTFQDIFREKVDVINELVKDKMEN